MFYDGLVGKLTQNLSHPRSMLLVSADDCHIHFLFVVIHGTSVLLVKVRLLLHNDCLEI